MRERLIDPRSVTQLAWRLRARIRARVGLPCDWLGASEHMRDFYRDLARRYLLAGRT